MNKENKIRIKINKKNFILPFLSSLIFFSLLPPLVSLNSCNKVNNDSNFSTLKHEFLQNFTPLEQEYYGHGEIEDLHDSNKFIYVQTDDTPKTDSFVTSVLLPETFSINEYNIFSYTPNLSLFNEIKQEFNVDSIHSFINKIKNINVGNEKEREILQKAIDVINSYKKNIQNVISYNKIFISNITSNFVYLQDAFKYLYSTNIEDSIKICDIYIKFLKNSFQNIEWLSYSTPYNKFLEFLNSDIKIKQDATLTQLICGLDVLYRTICFGNNSLQNLGSLTLFDESSKTKLNILIPINDDFISNTLCSSDGINFEYNGKSFLNSSVIEINLLNYEFLQNTIPDYFLNGFSNLRTFDFSCFKNVTSIGKNFLSNCSSLYTIDLSSLKKVSYVDDNFLLNCKNASNILFDPDSFYYTGINFLNGCSNFTFNGASWTKEGILNKLRYLSLHIPDGFLKDSKIDGTNFFNSSITGISSIEGIGKDFLKGSSITQFSLEPFCGLKNIDSSFLQDCSSLQEVELKTSTAMESINPEGFLKNCVSLRKIKRDITDYDGENEKKFNEFFNNEEETSQVFENIGDEGTLIGTDAINMALNFPSFYLKNWHINDNEEKKSVLELTNGLKIYFTIVDVFEPNDFNNSNESIKISGIDLEKTDIKSIFFDKSFANVFTELPDNFLNGFSNLIYVDVEQNDTTWNITKIGNNVFKDCSSLKQIPTELLSNVETIGDYFAYNSGFEEFSLLDFVSLKTIGTYFLNNCDSLQKITLFSSIPTTVGDYFICNNQSLSLINLQDSNYSSSSFSLPSNVFLNLSNEGLILGKYSFSFFDKFSSASIFANEGKWSLGENKDSTSFLKVKNSSNKTIKVNISYNGDNLDEFIGKELEGENTSFVLTINNIDICSTSIIHISFGSSFNEVSNIPSYFLKNLTNLEYISFSGFINVVSIGDYFLQNCASLINQDLSFFYSLKVIGNYFLTGTTKLLEVHFPASSNIQTIGDYFLSNSGIIEFDFSPFINLKQVGSLWFSKCSLLRIINVGIFSSMDKISELLNNNKQWFNDSLVDYGNFIVNDATNFCNYFISNGITKFQNWGFGNAEGDDEEHPSMIITTNDIRINFDSSILPIESLCKENINANNGKITLNYHDDRGNYSISIDPTSIKKIFFGSSYKPINIPNDFLSEKFTDLVEVNFGCSFSSVNNIGNNFMSNLHSLYDINGLNNFSNLVTIGTDFLANDTYLCKLNLSNWIKLTSIGKRFCSNLHDLESVIFGEWNSILYIDAEFFFANCIYLYSIYIHGTDSNWANESLQVVNKDYVFWGVKHTTNNHIWVTNTESMTTIANAFRGIFNLNSEEDAWTIQGYSAD